MEKFDDLITVEKVNTTNSLIISNEDRTMRSDMGNKLTHLKDQKITAKKKSKPTKKALLLADPNVKRWYDNNARGSPLTAEVRLRRLSHFCEVNNITPDKFAKLGLNNMRKATDLIEDHITWMEKRNHSPGYVESTLTSLKSWLRHFDVEIKRKIRINNPDGTTTIQNERVPNDTEMTEAFNRSTLREACAISLIAKAGLRPQVLGNHNGTDGLVLGDLPDVAIEDGITICKSTPPKVMVRKTLSKARHQYFTFLTENGTKKLLAYLNDRLSRGEKLDAGSPIIAPNTKYKTYRGKNSGKAFLPTQRITKEIRKVLRPRFLWRPYLFRAFFDTQLLMAESHGKIAHDFRAFFMGHKGGIEAKYTTNKGILTEEMMQEMREAFKRSEDLLDLEMKTQNIATQNHTTEKTDSTTTNLERKYNSVEIVQTIASLDQVETLVLQGWKFLSPLPQGKAVLERKTI